MFGGAGARRSIVPTTRGWVALGVLAGVTIAAVVAPSSPGIALAASIAVALGAALLSVVVACRRATGHLRAALSGPELVPRGEPASLRLALVGDRPRLGCRISFDRSSVLWGRKRSEQSGPSGDRPRARRRILAPGAGHTLEVTRQWSSGSELPGSAVPTMLRGIHTCRGAALWMYDPLGMWGAGLVSFPELTVVVHPVPARSPLAEPTPDLRQLEASGPMIHASMGAGGVDLLGVRPYQFGDRLTSVHWRSLSSTTPLLVREFGIEAANSGRLIIDDRAGVHQRAAFEAALDALTGAFAVRPAAAPPIELCSLVSGHAMSVSGGTTPSLLRWLAALEPRRTNRQRPQSSQPGWVVRAGDTVITTPTGATSLSALRDQGAQLAVAG